ncbi:MAG TPA: phosphoglycerate dehydrogenase [Candidatus Binatia bacterium]|nr:phosphoglycerate dehydrogenase [Candidatus Binatia bacterium]
MAYRVLVSEALAPEGLAILRASSEISVDERGVLKRDEIVPMIGEYDALIVRSGTKVTADVIAAGSRLKVIGRAGIGVDNIDVPAATRRGIVVMNTPGGNNVTTAEHAISMMLACARHIPQANASLRAGKWERGKFLGSEVTGKTLGVIGLGNIGRVVADRANGLQMRVVAYDPFVTEENKPLAVELVSLDDLLARSDFVTVHVPLTNETRNLIDAAALAKTKRGVRVVNCARGGIVDEAAVADAIRSGHVAGAAFDVFAEEPPPADHPLISLPQVVATPHLGASTGEAQVNVAIAIAEQVVAFLTRGAIISAVNMPALTPEQREVLGPFLVLGEKLGALTAQLCSVDTPPCGGAPVDVAIEYRGDVADHPTKTITAAIIRGLLVPILGADLNYVSAPVIARERGIHVSETLSMQPGDYRNRIAVKVKFSSGTTHEVAGAVFGRSTMRLVKLNNFFLEAVPEGYILMLYNRDVPGVVGRVGTLLGHHRVNIAGLELGRERIGGQAVSLFHVDDPVPDQVLAELKKQPDVISAALLRL